MALRSVNAEVDPGCHCNTGLFEQAYRQCARAQAEAAAVGIQIERTIGHDRDAKPQLTQCGQQAIAALCEHLAS